MRVVRVMAMVRVSVIVSVMVGWLGLGLGGGLHIEKGARMLS